MLPGYPFLEYQKYRKGKEKRGNEKDGKSVISTIGQGIQNILKTPATFFKVMKGIYRAV